MNKKEKNRTLAAEAARLEKLKELTNNAQKHIVKTFKTSVAFDQFLSFFVCCGRDSMDSTVKTDR